MNYYCIYCEPVNGTHETTCKLFDRQRNNQVIDGYGKILKDLGKLTGTEAKEEIDKQIAGLKEVAKKGYVEQPVKKESD